MQPKQPKQSTPDFLLPSHVLQLILGNTEEFPDQPRNIISPGVSWVTHRVPQDILKDVVEWLLQFHEMHVNWLGKLRHTLTYSRKDKDLVQHSLTRTKTMLFLLKPRLDSPVPLLKDENHHPSRPIRWHYCRSPSDIAEACEPRQPYNIQDIREL